MNDLLETFVKPEREGTIFVNERSWCPEDESHEAFKSLIVESFANKKFKKLTHVAHDLARRCIQWFGTPGSTSYTVAILIIRNCDFEFNKIFNEAWGSYAEYQINHDCIMVFKDGIREGEGPIKQLEECIEILENQPRSILQIVNQGDPKQDVMPEEIFKSMVKVPQKEENKEQTKKLE